MLIARLTIAWLTVSLFLLFGSTWTKEPIATPLAIPFILRAARMDVRLSANACLSLETALFLRSLDLHVTNSALVINR
jgi:hypothetical protein